MILGLLLWFSASFGLQEYGENYDHTMFIHPSIVTEVEFHAENEWLDIYGIYVNEMDKAEDIFFMPKQDYFTAGAKLQLNNISFNIEHMCQHPVGNLLEPINGEYGGYNKVWIEVSSK